MLSRFCSISKSSIMLEKIPDVCAPAPPLCTVIMVSSATCSRGVAGGGQRHRMVLTGPTAALCRFIPRHADELELDVDDPLYVEEEEDDYWYRGYNMRTGERGIFPAFYAHEVIGHTKELMGELGDCSLPSLASQMPCFVCVCVCACTLNTQRVFSSLAHRHEEKPRLDRDFQCSVSGIC